MIKFKEEGIPLWEYQVRRVEDNVFRIGVICFNSSLTKTFVG